jgi:hypothetical protein
MSRVWLEENRVCSTAGVDMMDLVRFWLAFMGCLHFSFRVAASCYCLAHLFFLRTSKMTRGAVQVLEINVAKLQNVAMAVLLRGQFSELCQYRYLMTDIRRHHIGGCMELHGSSRDGYLLSRGA